MKGWIECVWCGGVAIELAHPDHPPTIHSAVKASDFLRPDGTPYKEGETIPRCRTCGEAGWAAGNPSVLMFRFGDALPEIPKRGER